MIQYILECVGIQLVFLLIYEVFLKRETFFQWNRLYLIGTFALSLVLPWVKLEAFKTTVPTAIGAYPEYLWQMGSEVVVATAPVSKTLPWWQLLGLGGMLVAAALLCYKLYGIAQLRKGAQVQFHRAFTLITLRDSTHAFSFFKSVFLGDAIAQEKQKEVLAHELVHVKQWHSLDLLFFELMRIFLWFNPLVYLYQARVAELHEFIADAQVAQEDKKEHYQLLLSQIFQTQGVSFINPFFNQSLIKKRIVMLQKSKSPSFFKLKYLLLLPLLAGILVYTSCEQEPKVVEQTDAQVVREADKITYTVGDLQNLSEEEKAMRSALLDELKAAKSSKTLFITDGKSSITVGMGDGEVTSVDVKKDPALSNGVDIPFAVIDQVPVFPGCEDAEDQRKCFNEKMQRHIMKNFRYPEEAQKQGIQGRVAVMFTIQADGNIGNLKMRGPDPLLEAEAERIMAKLPQMTPGEQKGQKVNVPFSIPITFKLQGDDTASQNKEEGLYDQKGYPFAVVDQVPVFPGCESAEDPKGCFNQNIQNHIRKNFRYPEAAQEQGIQGRVVVLFTIDAQGRPSRIKMRGPDATLEAEAERIINKLPIMEPGKQDHKPVPVVYSIPITFKLQGDSKSTGQKGETWDTSKAKGGIQLSDYDYNPQKGVVSGTLKDEANLNLPGVTILVQGTERGAISDFDGNFKIKADAGEVLVMSYKGLRPLLQTVTN